MECLARRPYNENDLQFKGTVLQNTPLKRLYSKTPLQRDCTPRHPFKGTVLQDTPSKIISSNTPLQRDCTPRHPFKKNIFQDTPAI